MCRFIICLLLFCLSIPSSFGSRTYVTQTPYVNPYYNHYNNPYFYRRNYNPNYADMNALEKYTFNRNYFKENDFERLQRLEMQAFGAIQQGDFDTRYANVRSAILSRPKAHTQSSVWRNMADYFSGQMTGFTPQINQYPGGYSYYPSNYGTSSINEYSSPFGGHGMNIKKYGTSSGMGITLLD